MPNRWPIASGNWSDPAIWSGSLIPTASDDVYLNNQIVTLDQNITVLSIRNAGVAPANGGRIKIYDNFNISASLIKPTTGATPGLITFYGSGSTTIQSQIYDGIGALESGPAIYNNSTGIINIIGNLRAPTHTGASTTGVINGSTGTINIIGNISSSNNNAQNYGVANSFGVINVTGNVTAGSSNGTNPTILNQNTGIVNVTGNVFGCPFGFVGSLQNAILHNSIGTVTVTGNVQGAQTAGISSTIANTTNIIGQCIASLSSSAVSSTSTTATNIFSGPFINSGSRNAIYCYNVQMYKNATTSYRIGVSGSNDTITLLSEDQAPGMPLTTNVRSGIIYGPTNALTGSMAVPDSRSVSWRVAVDNTSGSAIVSPEDLWGYAITSLTGSNTIGQRLASTSTSASNAAIVSSFSN